MATISTANLTALADSIAKSLVDAEAALITLPTSNAPTIATITAGQNGASNSLRARIAALNDVDQEADLAPAGKVAAANMASAIVLSASTFYQQYRSLLSALDSHVGGLNAFLAANSLQVHPEFAAAFNAFATNATALGFKAATAIDPTHIFVPAVQTLGSIAVTGAAAGTFSAGTPIDTTKYAPAQLYLKNTAGGATGGTATSFTVTYTNAAGTAGQTATQALSGALAAGATLAIGSVVGSAVSNIVVNSGGVAADAIAVIVQPLRTVAY